MTKRYKAMIKSNQSFSKSLMDKQNNCSHSFVHVAQNNWFGFETIIYCFKCGVHKIV